MADKKGKPTLCWYCAKLGKCQVLRPCKDFVKYDYRSKYTWKEMAQVLGIHDRTLCSRLKRSEARVLQDIYEKTGKRFEYKTQNGEKRKHFILIDE